MSLFKRYRATTTANPFRARESGELCPVCGEPRRLPDLWIHATHSAGYHEPNHESHKADSLAWVTDMKAVEFKEASRHRTFEHLWRSGGELSGPMTRVQLLHTIEKARQRCETCIALLRILYTRVLVGTTGIAAFVALCDDRPQTWARTHDEPVAPPREAKAYGPCWLLLSKYTPPTIIYEQQTPAGICKILGVWLADCLLQGSHKSCAGPKSVTKVPTRLLDLRGNEVKVVDHSAVASYAALSHRWGTNTDKDPMLRLLVSNQAQFREGSRGRASHEPFETLSMYASAWASSICGSMRFALYKTMGMIGTRKPVAWRMSTPTVSSRYVPIGRADPMMDFS